MTEQRKAIFFKRFLLTATVISVSVGGLFLLNYFYCGKFREIFAYSLFRDSTFYVGPKYCPATWKLKAKTLKEVGEINLTTKFQVIAPKEDPELEKVLKDKFIGYNKYSAGESNNKFYIYESVCSLCELK